MNIEEQFENFKLGFIINNFADNIYFCQNLPNKKVDPYPPKKNIWTDQPINSIKTMKHL